MNDDSGNGNNNDGTAWDLPYPNLGLPHLAEDPKRTFV